jgi:hypothetical protein
MKRASATREFWQDALLNLQVRVSNRFETRVGARRDCSQHRCAHPSRALTAALRWL